MLTNSTLNTRMLSSALLAIAASLALVACGGSKTPEAAPAVDMAAAEAEAARQAEVVAKEQELAQREADLAAKEQEQEAARLKAEADEAARREAAARAAAKKPAAAPAAAVVAAKPAEPAKPVVNKVRVPEGTEITVALTSNLSSKTAKAGDRFQASVVSDILVKDKVAVPAGSRVNGTITNVISGSKAIGSVPTLGLKFDKLVLKDGQRIDITGELIEQGKSEKGRDTAKILGGAAAGAILGHQVDDGSAGKVLGGLLGGAVGAVAAKKTGSEVELASGATLTIKTGEAFRVVVK